MAKKKAIPLGEKYPTYGELIQKFYEKIGVRADRSHYSGGTKLLKTFAEEDKDFPAARIYTLDEIGECLFWLLDNGVKLENMRVLNLPDLLRSYVDNDKTKQGDLLAYLQGKSSTGKQTQSWEDIDWD